MLTTVTGTVVSATALTGLWSPQLYKHKILINLKTGDRIPQQHSQDGCKETDFISAPMQLKKKEA